MVYDITQLLISVIIALKGIKKKGSFGWTKYFFLPAAVGCICSLKIFEIINHPLLICYFSIYILLNYPTYFSLYSQTTLNCSPCFSLQFNRGTYSVAMVEINVKKIVTFLKCQSSFQVFTSVLNWWKNKCYSWESPLSFYVQESNKKSIHLRRGPEQHALRVHNQNAVQPLLSKNSPRSKFCDM